MKDGGPAFPMNHDPVNCPNVPSGMTIRDYFAAKAIRLWMKDTDVDEPLIDVDEDYIAKKAYKMADAMLKAREVKCEES